MEQIITLLISVLTIALVAVILENKHVYRRNKIILDRLKDVEKENRELKKTLNTINQN